MTENHKSDSFLENNNVEKSPLTLSDNTSTKAKIFFKRKRKKRDNVAVDTKETVAKVSFLEMFRYAMWWEKVINVAGLVCAAGSGHKGHTTLSGITIWELRDLKCDFRLITVMNTFFQVATVYKSDQDNPELIERFNIARDDFRDGGKRDCVSLPVNTVCIDMLVIGIAMFVGVYTFQHAWVFTSERISSRIRSMYLRSILRQDIAFFDNIGAGEVATRIETDTHLVQSGISEKVANAAMFIGSFPLGQVSRTFIAGFIIAFAQQAKIAGVLFLIVPLIATAGAGMNVFTSKYSQNALTYIAESGSLVEEVLSTIRTAKAFGSQVILLKLYDTYLSKARSQGFKTAISSAVGLCIFFFIIYASYALAFVWGVTLLLRNETEVGEIVGVLISTMIGSFSLAIAAPELQAIAKGQAAAAKIFDTIERIPPIDSASEEGLKPSFIAGNITFEDVDFSYPARLNVQVMKKFTATFHKGHLTALVGASGSGKSTAIGLIERFYDPLNGVIKLDGNDLRDINVKWLRSKIGMVGQEPVLFNETLRANVEHGLIGTEMEHWPDEQRLELVINACKVANADGFINTLPEKYDNSVGER
ncbi:P-loop containing nucleoside triphosphate hydrolase protein, partial [Wallemia mellicola]